MNPRYSTLFYFSLGEIANSVPHYHKLCSWVSHIWENGRGQSIRSALDKLRPGKTTFVIMVSPLPGKHWHSILKMKKPRLKRLGKLASGCIESWRAIQDIVMLFSHLGNFPGPSLSLRSLLSTWLGTRAQGGSWLSTNWYAFLTKGRRKLILLTSHLLGTLESCLPTSHLQICLFLPFSWITVSFWLQTQASVGAMYRGLERGCHIGP